MSKSANTQLYFLTFNCNKILDIGFVEKVSNTFPQRLPSLLLFGFEEVCSIFDSTDSDIVNKYLIKINELLLQALVSHYEVDFKTVIIHHVGAIGLILITPYYSKIKKLKTGKYSCGISFSSLKGGCGVRLVYDDQEYTIVTAHLSANEGVLNWNRRDQDSLKLLSSIDFGDGYGVIKPKNHIFFMGDLNYRVSRDKPTINDQDQNTESNEQLLALQYDSEKDELQTSIKRGSAFWGFKELAITFKPSYKYYNNTVEYNLKRVPSWCDRVLYLAYQNAEDVKVNNYNVISDVLTSDHRPVFLDVEVPVDAPNVELMDVNGYLTEDLNVFLKPTLLSKIQSSLTVIADFTLFGALYLTLTTKGRLILSLIALLSIYQIFF